MSDEMTALVLEEATDKMQKSVQHTQEEFGGIRTGRASPALVEKLLVNYHGTEVPLRQIAGFSVPEAQQLVVSPYDKSAIPEVEKAIQNASLGLNPANDGANIRLVFPPLTEERRQELVRLVRSMAEQGKVALRHTRRSARGDLEQFKKDGDISEDDMQRAEKNLDNLTHDHERHIQEALEAKEQELLEV